jgi:adenylylsulfate kinase-like enzyme
LLSSREEVVEYDSTSQRSRERNISKVLSVRYFLAKQNKLITVSWASIGHKRRREARENI